MPLFSDPATVRSARARADRSWSEFGWHPVGRWQSRRLVRQLARELGERRDLLDAGPVAIARCEDDVLFLLDDQRALQVHLSWTEAPASMAEFEDMIEFERWLGEESAFVRALQAIASMPDDSLHCVECGADWSKDDHGSDCATCGGFGLIRPCTACDGRCSGWWQRSVLDSNDSGAAHWTGRCRKTGR